VAAADRIEIGPFFSRLAAFFVDGLVLAPVNLALGFLLIGDFDPTLMLTDPKNRQLFDFSLIGYVTQALYSVTFVSLIQATPGKLAFRLRVVRADGERLMPDTAILRYLVVFLGNLVLPIEFLVSFFLMLNDPARRTVHDRVARTLVVRWRRSRPEEGGSGVQ